MDIYYKLGIFAFLVISAGYIVFKNRHKSKTSHRIEHNVNIRVGVGNEIIVLRERR